MIRDNITRELKSKSKKTGKEEGFTICRDKRGKLYPGKVCRGEHCTVTIPLTCPANNIVQGDFHTHTSMRLRDAIKEDIRRDPTVDEVKNIESFLMEERHEKIGIKGITSVTTPTYTDVLNALSFKCDDVTQGTVCVGYDLEDSKVECWTTKGIITDIQCKKASKEFIKRNRQEKLGNYVDETLEKWIIDLFDKEIINLKKDQ